ncbi:putative odorant receptor 83c [Anopheles ziemanni]|uniref:putative odorant receptor 83c n=1 Tax=Anopheles coustani TaxID=139045 RepID=UPI002659AB54|nr:putative odorant receptor 83c [Anopheles coustani]XP_058177390.1 putative odorant receptor 83c [Anopheles ziemanni]
MVSKSDAAQTPVKTDQEILQNSMLEDDPNSNTILTCSRGKEASDDSGRTTDEKRPRWGPPYKGAQELAKLYSSVIVYFVSNIYTMVKYSTDYQHLMKILVTVGTAVQLYVKFFVAIKRGFEFKEFTESVEQVLLVPFQCGSPKEVAVLQRTGRVMWFIFRLLAISFSCSGFVFGLYPLYAYYANDTVMPLFLHELPYYDWSTTGGYVVNMLFQVNIYTLGVVGATYSDVLFILCALYSMAHADIFILHLHELEEILNDPAFSENDNSAMDIKWKQCMYDHQQSVKFFNTVDDLFNVVTLVHVGMGLFSICDGMLLVALTDWYAAYFFLLIIFFQLTLYFLIGHYVELKVDEMYDTINSVPWYKLPVSNQKEFVFLLSRQQYPLTLIIYGFAPLNFTTYMTVLRGLYQFFVIIMRYVS